MADRDPLADPGRHSIVNVDDGPVLDVGLISDVDLGRVAADDGGGPDGDTGAEVHVPADDCGGVEIRCGMDTRHGSIIGKIERSAMLVFLCRPAATANCSAAALG